MPMLIFPMQSSSPDTRKALISDCFLPLAFHKLTFVLLYSLNQKSFTLVSGVTLSTVCLLRQKMLPYVRNLRKITGKCIKCKLGLLLVFLCGIDDISQLAVVL